ncbi:EAL domain-containing protein [Arthrobacter sp. CDRTa11]|uniref:putative bifunctional diguanylate cyclase/phosphodiesterase n=1 Tax=Arthrobacter sp. CDRTa11 TaxID=2651199 RepID=UPI002265ED97|nr:bifunctional diguanylate cyclase/phosphodiesterase [Arthrobacter sp. CDRTa11]UZX02273.1 EAL domain-containing protein [Arthrobacter sp. CDRTa11]
MPKSVRHRERPEGRTFGSLLDANPDGLIALAPDGTISLANKAAARLFGLSQDELLGTDHRHLLLAGSQGELVELFQQLQEQPGKDIAPREVHGVHSSGYSFSAEMAGAILEADEGTQLLVSVRSTAHRRAADADLRKAMSLLTATLESTADGILVVSSEGKLAGLNEQFLKMWGIPPELLDGDSAEPIMRLILAQVTHPEAFMARVAELQEDPAAESNDMLDFRDGRTFERYSRPQKVGDRIVGRVWSFRDVTPRRQAQEQAQRAMQEMAAQAEQLKAMAFQDPLTGLANRAVFNSALEAALSQPRLKSVDVLLLDLDDFKEVNDILGHQAGDDMLVEVARRLTGCVPNADVVARLGGDEFVVLLTACQDVEATAACIVRCLNVPMQIHDTMLRPCLSLGVASAGREAIGASGLLREADIAMYAAKGAGKNRFLRFQPDMMTALVQRTDMQAALQSALTRGEISVDFQPISSPRRGQVVKFEALARWDRGGERIPPTVFIPMAERSGLINQIGLEVLSQSLVRLAPWLREDPSRSLAVNVSGVQLQELDFADRVLDLAEASDVAAFQLVMEVTESVFFDADQHVIGQLGRLRDAGARVALDDFGTGYSSLGRLQDLPVDTVKIDKTFVSMIRSGAERLPILSSMINMAHSLGLTVTAEGIETPQQADYLIALDCDSLQGYLFSHPEPGERLDMALRHAKEALEALRNR